MLSRHNGMISVLLPYAAENYRLAFAARDGLSGAPQFGASRSWLRSHRPDPDAGGAASPARAMAPRQVSCLGMPRTRGEDA